MGVRTVDDVYRPATVVDDRDRDRVVRREPGLCERAPYGQPSAKRVLWSNVNL